MDYDNNDRKQRSVYSRKLKAGKRRTYFFDVRETRGNDFYVTVTETRKKFNGEGFERQKIFIYKEDFNKFTEVLAQAVHHVKTELMPDFDFDHYNHEDEREEPKLRTPRLHEPHHQRGIQRHYNGDRQHQADHSLDTRENHPHSQSSSDFQDEQHSHAENQGETPDMAVQQPIIDEHLNFIDQHDFKAEPLHNINTEELEGDAAPQDEMMNATSTSDKLASEQVDKW